MDLPEEQEMTASAARVRRERKVSARKVLPAKVVVAKAVVAVAGKVDRVAAARKGRGVPVREAARREARASVAIAHRHRRSLPRWMPTMTGPFPPTKSQTPRRR
jgi:hypothetical protein